MRYSEPLPQQLFNFLLFFGFGFADGLLFRLIEFFRKLFGNGKRAILIQDLLFSVASTVLMFLFLLVYADGNVRINLIAASVLGACVFFLTAGKPVEKVLNLVAAILRKTVNILTAPFSALSKKFGLAFEKLSDSAKKKAGTLKSKKKIKQKKSEKKPKKLKKKSKKDLKNPAKSV